MIRLYKLSGALCLFPLGKFNISLGNTRPKSEKVYRKKSMEVWFMYLSTGQVASLFNVSTVTIRNWTEQGILKYEIMGHCMRMYKEEDIKPILDIWNKFNTVFKRQDRGNQMR